MSTSDICKICKDGASKSNNDDVCELEEKLQNMSTDDNVNEREKKRVEMNDMLNNINMSSTEDNNIVSICANCGKEGKGGNMNTCNKCKQVKYCSATCKKKHRHKHKKHCERHLAELHDKELFKQPPPTEEDCPICFLRMPTFHTGSTYKSCCGKVICSGCVHAPVYDNQGNEIDSQKCAFCRAEAPSSIEEMIEWEKKRVEIGDPTAIYNQGVCYEQGSDGYPQNYRKALELWHRAGELGYAIAYASIGYAYDNGEGVEVDSKKATYYYELAAMGGDVYARHNLGCIERDAGNFDRALRHWMISAGDGYAKSLEKIKELYSNDHATKEDYTTALRLYQEYLGEIKSVHRDKAAAADENYQYY